MKKQTRSPHILPSYKVGLRDYNGVLQWSVASVQERYTRYCHKFHVEDLQMPRPMEHTEGAVRWIYPIMDSVIEGIKRGDKACIEIGVEFVEEDDYFVFGRILKSNTARALRQTQLSPSQIDRLRKRIVGMLLEGQVPREFKEYVKLLRHIGFGNWWPAIEKKVQRDNPYVMHYYDYLQKHASDSGIANTEVPGVVSR